MHRSLEQIDFNLGKRKTNILSNEREVFFVVRSVFWVSAQTLWATAKQITCKTDNFPFTENVNKR